MEELKEMISNMGKVVDAEQREMDNMPTRVLIDQSFNVTGIGCVVLGVVSQGVLNAKDKMLAYPTKKPLEIRSIQMHDVDVKSSPTGARVGLALKNIQSKDIDRGFVLSEDDIVATGLVLESTLSQLAKPFAVADMLHVYVGLQSAPMRIESITLNGENIEKAKPGKTYTVKLSGTKEISYSKNDRFLLTNLDGKQRFIAVGYSQ
jgi:selenocysteine-specific translation elongation factor